MRVADIVFWLKIWNIGPDYLPFAEDFLMQITINGEAREIPAGETLQALLVRLDIDPRKVAVERNLAIVPKGLYGDTPLTSGDAIEIVHFIGGG